MPDNLICIKNFLTVDDVVKRELMEDIFYSKKVHDEYENSPGVSTNFKIIRDRNNFCKKLYNKFLRTTTRIFGDIILDERNKTTCWSLCTNKDYWKSVVHNHVSSSSINAVFYLQVPKINDEYCGKIFLLNESNVWEEYQPEPFDFLIMPNYMYHDTEYHDTEEWRVSINLEIICKNEIDWSIVKNQ